MTSAKSIRYEFRAFLADLSFMEQRFESRGRLLSEADSAEIYILARHNIDANLKIKCEHLELKTLEERVGPLELWNPSMREPFPITTILSVDWVGSELGVTLKFDLVRKVNVKDLVEIAACHDEWTTLPVKKQRRKFQMERGLAEVARVNSGAKRIKSATVEAQDFGLVVSDKTPVKPALEANNVEVIDGPFLDFLDLASSLAGLE